MLHESDWWTPPRARREKLPSVVFSISNSLASQGFVRRANGFAAWLTPILSYPVRPLALNTDGITFLCISM